jgi:hypothetical protein
VNCAPGRHVVREGLEEWCALSDGTRDGPVVEFADETRKAVRREGQYENGQASGRWVSNYVGTVQRDSYRNGVRHGPSSTDYPNEEQFRAEFMVVVGFERWATAFEKTVT